MPRATPDAVVGDLEEQYRLLMECVTDYALILLDTTGRVIAWNVGAERIFGYRAAEIVGRPFTVFFTPEDVATRQPEKELEAATATGRAGDDRWFVRTDGTRLWCSGILTALRREDGTLRGFAKVLRDQTERRRREEELRQANERFCLAAAAVKGLIYDVDLRAQTVLRSEGLFAIVGYHPSEIEPAMTWWMERLHPDDRVAALAPASHALDDPTREEYEVEYRIRHRNGDYIYVSDRALIRRDGEGRPIRLVGWTYDITARRRAVEALRESEERYRIITELTSDYSYALRFGPDHSAELEQVTEGFTRITGYTVAEVNARGGWGILIHPEDTAKAAQGVERVLSGEVNASVLRLITKSGEVRWVRNLNKPIWDAAHTRVVRMIGAAQDITERERVEQELRQSRERLQALSRQLIAAQENERRRLAHELHDEIGQTLTAISINLQAIQAVTGEAAQPRLREAVAIVDQAITQVRHLSLDLRPSVLDDLGLEAALRWYADGQIRRTGLDIRLDTNLRGCRLPVELETTCFRVAQEALTNVVRHARARRVWIELQRQEAVELTIRDDGAGFDPQAARARAAGGASFGLLGMQERVELLGGEFLLEAQPGRGTSVRARFPESAALSAHEAARE